MLRQFLGVAVLLWLHVPLIALGAWLGARARTLALGAVPGVVGAFSATLGYWLLQNGVAPVTQPPRIGLLAALLVASALPILGASVCGFLVHRAGGSKRVAVLVGALIGFLLMVPMPVLQSGLGCAFTGLCP